MPGKLRLPKWIQVLVFIYKGRQNRNYSEQLHRVVKGSLTHLREIVKDLAAHDLIEILPIKKRKMLYLTDKGRKISERILSMKHDLEDPIV